MLLPVLQGGSPFRFNGFDPVLSEGMPAAWITVLAAALPAAAAASLIIGICLLYHLHRGAKIEQSNAWHADKSEGSVTKKRASSCAAVLRLGANAAKDPLNSSVKQSNKFASVWRSTYPIKAFKWSDNPSLVAEAVEHGWATFAFTYANLDSPISSKLWDLCTRLSQSYKLIEPEISWEVGAGSDYMQKIRLNPGSSSKRDGEISRVQALQTILPLPGPPLGPLSFPQEGYFEITVLGEGDHESTAELSHTSFNENEHAKLIAPRASNVQRVSSSRYGADDLIYTNVDKNPSSYATNIIDRKEGMPSDNTEPGKQLSITSDVCQKEGGAIDGLALQSAASEQQICAVGLAAGSAPPFRLPGSDAASIGFFSNGRVFLNGAERNKPSGWRRRSWVPAAAAASRNNPTITVGCGFNPASRRLFFTLNGDMVDEISLPSGNDEGEEATEFAGHPLFPTVGANYDVTVTANFGQAAFEFAPANAQRVPDPCFRRPPAGSKVGVEDSADLFSMGRINSQWLADLGGGGGAYPSPSRVTAPGAAPPSTGPTIPTSEVDSDLFEIVLDSRTS